jgi:hypothetical protein
MAQSAFALIATTSGVQAPANDDSPDGEGSAWRALIERMKTISERCAVHAAQHQRKGWDVHEYCEEMLRRIYAPRRPGRDWLTGKCLKGKKSRTR